MKCEACGAPASVHLTEAYGDNYKQTQLCSACAQQKGMAVSGEIAQKAQWLRQMIAFIRANNRIPSLQDLGFSWLGAGSMFPVAEDNPEYRARLVQDMDALAAFIETHGRPPSEQEVPDPFSGEQ